MSIITKYPNVYAAFNQLCPIALEEFVFAESKMVFREVKAKTLIQSPGDKDLNFNIILSGMVRIYYTNQKGQEFTKTILGQYDIASAFSEMIQGLPSRVYIEPLVNSTILQVSYDDFEILKNRNECWKEFARVITEKYFIFREEREYDILVLSLKERYEKLGQRLPELVDKIPQYIIASFLSATPVSLSRAIKDL